MISVLGFFLECAATAAIIGTATGVLSAVALVILQPATARLTARGRSDIAFVAGILPALAVVTGVVAAAAPSFGNALGIAQDHCPGHADHFHICFVHSAGLRPALATLGAFALVGWLCRTAFFAKRVWDSRRQTVALERLARRQHSSAFPVFVVPGAWLCHAAGLFRRRIFLSALLAERLSPNELACALAHEEAHLRRRDPLARFVLGFAGLFVPPPLASYLQRLHREAGEEACDAAAARQVGDGAVVAEALLAVAKLGGARAARHLGAPAFGVHALERRVKALVGGAPLSPNGSHWPILGAAAIAAFGVLGSVQAASLHHAAEILLGNLF